MGGPEISRLGRTVTKRQMCGRQTTRGSLPVRSNNERRNYINADSISHWSAHGVCVFCVLRAFSYLGIRTIEGRLACSLGALVALRPGRRKLRLNVIDACTRCGFISGVHATTARFENSLSRNLLLCIIRYIKLIIFCNF